MENAEKFKDIAEFKQRAIRKYREVNGSTHKPLFFKESVNPLDKQVYYEYNRKYFEEDRKSQNWERCPDLWSDEFYPEVI